VTESDYLADVYEICKDAGVSVHHCNDSRHCHGAGFPDLLLIGVRGILFREVKASATDRPRPEQTAILWLLRAAGQDAEVWNATDLLTGRVADEIARIA
jgi:hypothetical protein